ncbi:MAG TPA: 30S ribosome-binding factor RbfA [Gemmatimonadales bacterium]|nr:30S ribosome-binding factor RbfA [Gemmatimonadales bacterium]
MVKRRGRGTPRRPEQVSEQVRQILSEMLVHGEIRDPRVSLATITAVKVAPDLSFARVWVAIPGSKDEQAKAIEGLTSAAGFIRSRVAQELTTYTAPEFRFVRDEGAERGARVDAILAEIRGGSPDPGDQDAPADHEAHDQADGADGHE